MDCERAEQLVSKTLDGEAAGDEARALEEHCASCAACRGYRAEQAKLHGVLQRGLSAYLDAVRPARERLRPRRWRMMARIAAVLVLMMGFAIVGYYVRPGPVPGTHPTPESAVESVDGGLRSSDRFITGPSESATLRLKTGSVVMLSENTRLDVAAPASTGPLVSVSLDQGKVRILAAESRGTRPAFRVDTPAGSVETIGTDFEVALAGDIEKGEEVMDGMVTRHVAKLMLLVTVFSGEVLVRHATGEEQVVRPTTTLVQQAPDAKCKLPFGTSNTIIAVRAKSVNSVLKAVVGIVTSFDADAGQMMKQKMNGGLQMLPGIDLDAPVAILILDPKKFDEPVVGVFTIKDAEAFKGIKQAQVQVVGKLGIIGKEEGIVAEVAQELKGLNAVPVNDLTDMIVANADVGAIVKRYKMDIQGALQLAKVKLGGVGGDMEEPARDAVPDAAKEIGLKAIEYAAKLVDEIEKQVGPVELGLTPGRELITARLTLEAVPGTAFATYLTKNNVPATGHLSLFGYVDAIAKIIGMDIFPTRAELPADEKPITYLLRNEGNKAILGVNVPMKPVRDFANVMKKKMQKIMQDMMKKKMERMMQDMMKNMQLEAGLAPVPVERVAVSGRASSCYGTGILPVNGRPIGGVCATGS